MRRVYKKKYVKLGQIFECKANTGSRVSITESATTILTCDSLEMNT